MAFPSLLKTVGIATAGTAMLAAIVPYITTSFLLPSFTTVVELPYNCHSQSYQTEIISLNPLVIYIHDFISSADINGLLDAGNSRFSPSEVVKDGQGLRTPDRTSSSAGLPRDAPAVACVLGRARSFLGTMLTDGWDEIGPPQLVRYTAGQRYKSHHDWYETPMLESEGSGRTWNRVASFFVILQDNCTGGETYFPYVTPVSQQDSRKTRRGTEESEHPVWKETDPVWRKYSNEGGVAFRPIAGNAIFWVNLHTNGTGDTRTLHAGLPVGSGQKTAMNIWPRRFYQRP